MKNFFVNQRIKEIIFEFRKYKNDWNKKEMMEAVIEEVRLFPETHKEKVVSYKKIMRGIFK
ncbi:MAG: hypothetical protein KDK36_07620 [Leptospiraceae bacterium]|nr:hypothetical protein [Leptospiraceae bacterium]